MIKRLCTISMLVLFAFCCVTSSASAKTKEQTLRIFLAGYPSSQSALTRYLWQGPITAKELRYKRYIELRRLRNAIFAVKQARFRSADLRAFYKKQRWYRPRRSPSKIRLSAWAKKNLRTILIAENAAKRKAIATLHKRSWGEKPQITIQGALFCFNYGAYRVIQESSSVWIAYKGANSPCEMHPQKVIYRRNRKDDDDFAFRGIYKNFAFLWRKGASDWQHLTILDLSQNGKAVYKNTGMPPNSNIRFDRRSKRLLFNLSLKLPPSCRAEKIKSCWKTIQAKHPALKGQAAPVCKCPGLGSLVTGQYAWNPRSPKASPKLQPKVECGCTS